MFIYNIFNLEIINNFLSHFFNYFIRSIIQVFSGNNYLFISPLNSMVYVCVSTFVCEYPHACVLACLYGCVRCARVRANVHLYVYTLIAYILEIIPRLEHHIHQGQQLFHHLK